MCRLDRKISETEKKELSMIDVAHAILEDNGDTMSFVDIVNEIQKYLNKDDSEIRNRLPQFYTDLNVDGSFISLGDNVWGLRKWYPYDSIDEAISHPEDDEDRKTKKHKKVNAFLADAEEDDDVIDYNDDDPEDDEIDSEDSEYVDNEGIAEDSEKDLGKYDNDISDFGDDPEDPDDNDPNAGLPDGLEGQLAEFGDTDNDTDPDDESYYNDDEMDDHDAMQDDDDTNGDLDNS